MTELEDLNDLSPYSMKDSERVAFQRKALNQLTRHHYAGCSAYHRILDLLGYQVSEEHGIEEIPFLPARIFKEQELVSVERSQIVKTLTSSGTTGQHRSKIFLDSITASQQSKVLAKIMKEFIGPTRLPMLVIDETSAMADWRSLSARGAAIIGFSRFGKNLTYALDENGRLDRLVVEEFIANHSGAEFLLFGFTSVIWESLCKPFFGSKSDLNLERAVVLHGGGWKKMAAASIDNAHFKHVLLEQFGIRRVHNYYGMVEQTGSIFMECAESNLHTSVFSDVLIRDSDFSICRPGQVGLIEVLSLLPESYPGHVVLTEDLGEMKGVDDCRCGRLGKYFRVYGRIPDSENRGCSDAHV